MSSARNEELRRFIAQEQKKLVGMSDMDINRQPILERIKAYALQLEAEPHWTTVPVFWVTIIGAIAGCLAAYYGYLSYYAQEKKPDLATRQPEKVTPPSPGAQPNSHTQSAPVSPPSPSSK